MFLAVPVAVLNQLTGINAVLYYARLTIFKIAGSRHDSSLLQSIAIGVTLLIFTIVAMFIIDRFGRRILLLIGSVGMMLCQALLAGVFYTGAVGNGRLVLAALIGFIASFAMSQGEIVFVFISEVFPNAVRGKGQAWGTFVLWTMTAAVTWSFPVVAEKAVAAAFAFFAVMMAIQFVFAWKIMPETKDTALEDIGKQLGA